MSKAILVMDMPKSCPKCDFVYREMCCCGLFLIQTAAIESVEGYANCRPTWCPLREVPQKKEEHPKEYYEFGNLGVAFVNGYNACINEIIGKDG